jgi:hypothetical protein
MLASEIAIQEALNEAGCLATGELLKRFDTDGSPIIVGQTKLTSKGQISKEYQTPYGVSIVARHVYQSNQGGKTYCPMEREARLVQTATPRLARQVSHKYAEFGAPRVLADLEQNHQRKVSLGFVQQIAEAVAAVALLKEESWHYATPQLEEPVASVAIGIDGTSVLMHEDGWRQAMVGTVALYDQQGERLHTTYVAATPEYGKQTFLERMDREIQQIKKYYPEARTVGVADGAADNWDFLKPRTDSQILDFWHAVEYLTDVADVVFARQPQARCAWLTDAAHRLKHEDTGARQLMVELEQFLEQSLQPADAEPVRKALTYFRNHASMMNYAAHVDRHLPIGSGVTEAACKVIVKQRLCASGMRWKDKGAAAVLSLRALSYSTGRWDQFWQKIDQYGFSLAA